MYLVIQIVLFIIIILTLREASPDLRLLHPGGQLAGSSGSSPALLSHSAPLPPCRPGCDRPWVEATFPALWGYTSGISTDYITERFPP